MSAEHTLPPVLAITMGDVNGVGPEILAKALARPEPWRWCRPVVFGSVRALDEARRFAPECPTPVAVTDVAAALAVSNAVPVVEWGVPGPVPRPGTLDPQAGGAAVVWIEAAVREAMAKRIAGMVTCPISKECIIQAGCAHTGHTTLIAAMTGALDYRMCLFTDTMRIVHITAHLSLRNAIDSVREDRILRTINIAHAALRRMGMDRPRVAVAALNPHAGEAGTFGREEIEEIAPAIEAARGAGIDCSGPWPPDTVFKRMQDGEFDVVVAMYHDQGHIPLKLIAMDEGVNVTLGIPIVRTSVDHGTAFDIAGQGVAREHSLCAAVRMASQLTGWAG
jgi:4-hydroxythreonine-4-phosphate dehydrogenase